MTGEAFLVHFVTVDGLLMDPIRTFKVTADNELDALARIKRLVGTSSCPMSADAVDVLDDRGNRRALWRIPKYTAHPASGRCRAKLLL